jgi:transposase
MPKALSKDLVERLLLAYLDSRDIDDTCTQRELAARFMVSQSKVQKLVAGFEAGRTVEELVRLGPRGLQRVGRVMSAEVLRALDRLIDLDQTCFLDELADRLYAATGVAVTEATVCRALHRLGYSRKKVRHEVQQHVQRLCLHPTLPHGAPVQLYMRAVEASAAAQAAFTDRVKLFDAAQLVFIDEVGTDSRSTRRSMGRAVVGARTTACMPQGKTDRHTSLGVLSGAGGLVDYFCVEGGMGTLDLLAALETSVVPHLNPYPGPNSVVVMDNNGTHRNAEVKALICATGAIILYTPPYSPQFNPIESLFNVLKHWIRRHRAWVDSPEVTAPQALHAAFSSITFEQAMGFIRGTGFYAWDVDPLAAVAAQRAAAAAEQAAAQRAAADRRRATTVLLATMALDLL